MPLCLPFVTSPCTTVSHVAELPEARGIFLYMGPCAEQRKVQGRIAFQMICS
uniref:Uncharacterized protein n=1 Tax=Setaria italica TaxID=4555 RepID=K4AP71_SETIT